LDKVAPEKELIENVHGVRGTFLDIGAAVRSRLQKSSDPVFSADAEPKVYFIGKMLWSKGLGSLMELLKFAEESANLRVSVDMYGGGPDMEVAAKKAVKLSLDMPFHGPLDHAELAYTHKIFVNPSTSEVLCTTSAEALAMGKFVILPSHPSNDFFAQVRFEFTFYPIEIATHLLFYLLLSVSELFNVCDQGGVCGRVILRHDSCPRTTERRVRTCLELGSRDATSRGGRVYSQGRI
jgi:Glycosyl transferases group 1